MRARGSETKAEHVSPSKIGIRLRIEGPGEVSIRRAVVWSVSDMLREALAACALAVAAELLYLAWSERATAVVADVVQFVGSGQSCGAECCEDERCSFHNLRRIVALLDSARVSLDVCVYALSSRELSAAVVAASERGVTVRMILDHDMAYGSSSSAFDLALKGTPRPT